MTEAPTPAQPYVLNEDGTGSLLVYKGRTLRIGITHHGLDDPTGYEARCGFKKSTKDAETLMAASTTPGPEDGTITLSAVTGGTRIEIVFTDEMTGALTAKSGYWDVLLESPGGEEDPVIPTSPWSIWPEVVS